MHYIKLKILKTEIMIELTLSINVYISYNYLTVTYIWCVM